MMYRGRVKNRVVILDPPASLAEGSEVQVISTEKQGLPPTWAEVFKDLIGKAEGLPELNSPDRQKLHFTLNHYTQT